MAQNPPYGWRIDQLNNGIPTLAPQPGYFATPPTLGTHASLFLDGNSAIRQIVIATWPAEFALTRTGLPAARTADLSLIAVDVSKITGFDAAVDARLTGIQADIATMDGNINSMDADITSMLGDISSIQSTLTAATSGTTAQYMRGDGTLATFPSIPAAQVQSDWNAGSGMGAILNKPSLFSGAYADLSGKPTLGTAAAQNTSAFDASGAASTAQAYAIQRGNHTGSQAISTITGLQTTIDGKEPTITAGTSAQYWRGDKTWQTLPTVATWSFNNSPGRSIVTTAAAANGWQPSSTRASDVSYSCTITTTASIGGNQEGYIVLEIAATNSTTAGDWVEVNRFGNGQAITLAVALQSVQKITGNLSACVPSGYYARLRSVNVSGTPSYSYVSGQEVLK